MRLQRYINYEKPDGWSRGEPEVLIATSTINKLGMPVVNYPSLQQYLTDTVSIPFEAQTRVRLFGSSRYGITYGHYAPFGNTIHINATMAERHLAHKGGAMAVVGHEGRHRADFCNHKGTVGAALGGRLLTILGGYELGEYLARAPLGSTYTELIPYVAILGAAGLTQIADPMEIRARRIERGVAGSAHEMDILFPNSPRTELLRQAGSIPAQILERLDTPPGSANHGPA